MMTTHPAGLLAIEAATPPALVAVAAAADLVGIVSIHWEVVIIAAIAAVPATIAATAAFVAARSAREEAKKATVQGKETLLRVDGRMEELLRIARKEATAQATLDEKAAEHQRKGEAAVVKANIDSSKGESP